MEHEGEHASRWAAVVRFHRRSAVRRRHCIKWVKKAEIDSGKRSGVPSDVSDRLKALERENRELRRNKCSLSGSETSDGTPDRLPLLSAQMS